MGCNCKMLEIIIAIVIIVFTFWQVTASKWIIAVAAILLLIHALSCKACSAAVSGSAKKKRR